MQLVNLTYNTGQIYHQICEKTGLVVNLVFDLKLSPGGSLTIVGDQVYNNVGFLYHNRRWVIN